MGRKWCILYPTVLLFPSGASDASPPDAAIASGESAGMLLLCGAYSAVCGCEKMYVQNSGAEGGGECSPATGLYKPEMRKRGRICNKIFERRGSMRRSWEKTVVCGILLSQIVCCPVLAKEHTNGPCYQNTVDTEHSNFDEGAWKYRFSSSSGADVILEEGKKHTFLMINGSISSEKMVIEKGRAYIGIEGLCRELELRKTETADAITVENDRERVTLDKKTLSFRRGNESLGTQGRMVDQEIFVPIRAFSEWFYAAVTYSEADLMPLSNPLIDIDNREKGITKEQALQMTGQKVREYYHTFEPRDIYADKAVVDDMLLQIQEGMEHMQYGGETAGFWLIKAPCLLLMDKSTGEIYYKTGNGKAGHGSYLESIQKLDGNADGLFEYLLVSGF